MTWARVRRARTSSSRRATRHQVWELDVPLPTGALRGEEDVRAFEDAFHEAHERVFAVHEPGQ